MSDAVQVNKLASLDTFMNDISTGLDAEVCDGPDGKDNLMKVWTLKTSSMADQLPVQSR